MTAGEAGKKRMQKYSSPIKETDDENRQHSSMNDVSEEEDDNYSSDKYDGSSSSHVLQSSS